MAEGGDYIHAPGKGRGLPYGVPTERQPLRQPSSNAKLNDWHTPSQNFISDPIDREAKNSSHSEPQSTNELLNNCDEKVANVHEVPKIALSPNAAEFVPRSIHSMFSSNHQAEEENSSFNQINNFEDTHCDSLYDDIMVHVKDLLEELAVDPGKFDVIVQSLLTMLVSDMSSAQTLKDVIEMIFVASILEPNLRYNGARLCNYLSQNLLAEGDDKIFRNLLLQRCQQELTQSESRVEGSNPSDQTWLNGLILFIGELFIHLEIKSPDDTIERLNILGISLIHQLILLMKHPNELNLKCVVQVLKFTGAALEELLRRINKTWEMDQLAHLIETECHKNKSGNVQEMLKKILDLRENNWGQSRISPVICEEPFMGDFPCGEPVLYGPDGQPITMEETQFLESNRHLYEDDDYPEYADFGTSEWSTEDDQMDDEIAAAYEEFLAQHPGCNRIQNS